MRRYHVQKINEHNKKQNEEMEKAQGRTNVGDNNRVLGPAVNPSNMYNF